MTELSRREMLLSALVLPLVATVGATEIKACGEMAEVACIGQDVVIDNALRSAIANAQVGSERWRTLFVADESDGVKDEYFKGIKPDYVFGCPWDAGKGFESRATSDPRRPFEECDNA